MSDPAYNYTHFDGAAERGKFLDFAREAPLVTGRAPDFPLEDLESGETVNLSDLWRRGDTVIVEFGSFT